VKLYGVAPRRRAALPRQAHPHARTTPRGIQDPRRPGPAGRAPEAASPEVARRPSGLEAAPAACRTRTRPTPVPPRRLPAARRARPDRGRVPLRALVCFEVSLLAPTRYSSPTKGALPWPLCVQASPTLPEIRQRHHCRCQAELPLLPISVANRHP
jgi:hypothetical protein